MLFARYGQGITRCFMNGKSRFSRRQAYARSQGRIATARAPYHRQLAKASKHNCAKLSASTMEPNLPSIHQKLHQNHSKCRNFLLRSAQAPGKRAASKTPSDVCGRRYHAKTDLQFHLRSRTRQNRPASSTTHRENAWTSKPPPRHSPNLFPLLHFKRKSISPPARG